MLKRFDIPVLGDPRRQMEKDLVKIRLEILIDNLKIEEEGSIISIKSLKFEFINIFRCIENYKRNFANSYDSKSEEIKFLSNFVLNYHTGKKMENRELIKYTLVCQVILYKYYKQIPDLKSIREFVIISEFFPIYKMLLTKELKYEQNRRNMPFDFQISVPKALEGETNKNINKLQIEVNDFQNLGEKENLLCDFLSKYNEFFVNFGNLQCDLKSDCNLKFDLNDLEL